MYEANQTDIGSQCVRVQADASWLTSFSQQADSTRPIHGRSGRTADQITKGKAVPTWIRLQSD